MKRLLLFDVDGTLVSGGPGGGAAKAAFHAALLEVFGTAGPIDSHDFSGKTDPQIARELLVAAGLTHAAVDGGFPRMWPAYLAGLEEGLLDRPVVPLPGVHALLEALAAEADVALGLLTGNLADGARLKLTSAGLHRHFRVGGYGSDHEERDELPGIALERAEAEWGVRFDPEDVLVIGDTPRDVRCGRAGGLTTVAVATGSYSGPQLEASRPDHLLPDLRSTHRVLELLVGGSKRR